MHFPHPSYYSSKTCILNHIFLLAQVTLIMVTADCADMFEQFQHVKQLNTTAEITHNVSLVCLFKHIFG